MLASDVADISDTGIALHPQQFFEGLATLFAAGLLARLPGPVLWCLRGRDLFAPALSRVGLHPDRLIFCETWKDHEVLPAMEEGLRCKGLAGVVGELVALPLKTSRRLQLAAAETGVTALAIHRWRKHGGSGLDNREPKPYSSTPRHVRAGPAHRQSKGEGAEFHIRAHSRIAAKATQQKRSGTKGETGYTSYGIASTGSVRALGTTQRCAHILTRITSQLPPPAQGRMPIISPERHIIALPADELEKFAREWAMLKTGYYEVDRFSGAGDMGRDVVGYLTKDRHEGPWHNYQCKQYGKAVSLDVGLRELGKILYFAHQGEFTAPTKYFFVAPKGVARTLRTYVSKPSELKKALVENWEKYCASGITKKKVIPLTGPLKAFIQAWDFSNVTVISVDAILDDPAGKILMAKRFKEDPAPPPKGVVPGDLEAREMPYVQQLIDAYGERDKCSYPDHEAVRGHDDHGPHLTMQRERFFAADAFNRFYRDNTMIEEIDLLHDDVFHGVAGVHGAKHDDSLTRADAVLSQAANIQPSGVLSRHARVPVKQGICHHFANEGKLKWRKK